MEREPQQSEHSTQNSSEVYNGWSNQETWVVVLWLNRTYGSYQRAHNIVTTADSEQEAVQGLLTDVQACLSQQNENALDGDLLSAAMKRVNWEEIASSVASHSHRSSDI